MSSAADAVGGARVVFREAAIGDSRLWETKRIQHANLNRLHLRSIECILDPTVSADSIIGGSRKHRLSTSCTLYLPSSFRGAVISLFPACSPTAVLRH